MLKRKSVIVLGAGPAGLLAAQAAVRSGWRFTIYSARGEFGLPKKSELFGCQYLHDYIPGLNLPRFPDTQVRYQLIGSSEGYRQKVYGDQWTGTVSPDEYGPEVDHTAWDLRAAYNVLWDRFAHNIKAMTLTPQLMASLRLDHPKALIVNTIPAPAVCKDMENHKFASQNVWAMGSRSPEDAQYRMPYVAPAMTVQCNGDKDTGWYRAASVFGYSTMEWPGGKKPPIDGVVSVTKPLSTDCACWESDKYLRLGRYGRWEKGYLVHQAYRDAVQAMPW